MAGLGPYGAEAGIPCTDNDYCSCAVLTDGLRGQGRVKALGRERACSVRYRDA